MHMRQTSSAAKPEHESLYGHSNEPGENVKQGEDETESVIHQLFNLVDF